MSSRNIQLFDFGATIRASITVRDTATNASLIDPSTLTFVVEPPDDQQVSYVYGVDQEVGRTGLGKFYLEIVADKAGKWTVRVNTTGPVVGATSFVFVVGLDPTL